MITGHLSDDEIELYCLRRLPEPAVAKTEEHLLLCVSCQVRCEDAQTYVHTLRRVLAETPPRPENGLFRI